MNNKPVLHHIRILDFTWVLAGPYATRLLGDFGAEVIKVQPLLPPENDDVFERGDYNTWNRNKRGITLNLAKPEEIALAKKLVSISDAVIENFTPRVMANWGLDYSHLKKIKSDIIMVSMSAEGSQSSRSHYAGFAPTVHALSGLTGSMSINGKPVGPGFAFADHITGLHASLAILKALEYRRQTGEGQYIDLSETDLIAGLIKEKGKPGELNLVVPCKGENRWLAITVDTEEAWEGLKKAIGNPEWADNAKYSVQESRIANAPELEKSIVSWAKEYTPEEAVLILQKKGIAAGIINNAADIASDRQIKERGFLIRDANLPFTDASPIKMAAGGADYKRAAPSPGQDNDYVYGKLLGLSKNGMVLLKKNGVI